MIFSNNPKFSAHTKFSVISFFTGLVRCKDYFWTLVFTILRKKKEDKPHSLVSYLIH